MIGGCALMIAVIVSIVLQPVPLPPPPNDTGTTGGVVEAPQHVLSEEERLALRMEAFAEQTRQADNAYEKGRFDEAIREYSVALDLLPGDSTALLGRARAQKAKVGDGKCSRRAIRDLLELAKTDPRGAWLNERMTAIAWMGDCGSRYARRRLDLARELAEESVASVTRPHDVRVMLAELLLVAAEEEEKTATETSELRDEAERQLELYLEHDLDSEGVAVPRALVMVADLRRETGDIEGAVHYYEQLLKEHPNADVVAEVRPILEDLSFELELQQLDKTQGFRPTQTAQAHYNRGLTALERGDFAAAASALTDAIEESPWFPHAYYARGRTYARMGRFSKAVDDLSRAIRMDRSDYEAHMTLGLLYMNEFAGTQDQEAIEHLSAALRLRPDLHHLHLLLGELFARTDREKARSHYQRYIQLARFDDPDAKRARRALEELEREIRRDEPTPILPPAEASLRFLEPALQRMINEAYLRGTEHRDPESAERILMEARAQFPSEPVVFNELAKVVYHQNQLDDARLYWEQSLTMREDQVEVHERLGLLMLESEPQQAIVHLRRAAELGSLPARYSLAELLWRHNRPLEASDQLDVYLRGASDWDLHWGRAQTLRRAIDRRFYQFYAIAGIFIGLLLFGSTWRVWHMYRGSSLRQLLERAPKSFPDVARILSLIRHEILKHNTAFLADVGSALELESPDAEQRCELLGRRFFGDPARPLSRGIHGRFVDYLEELEKVGRAHDVVLNLSRKDPIFRPMIAAWAELRRWAPRLRDAYALRPSEKLELARCLHRCGHVLGRQAFERLSELIAELCITEVHTGLIQRIFEQVRGEKQFVDEAIEPLAVDGVSAPVRIFRVDLEDILANVFRNALRSSLSYAEPPVALAVELTTEYDEITGLGTLAIRVKDRSSEPLSTEMLRGRYVERGMGITVDLLSRYDGSIGVEPEPGWSKAVVLRFFILENSASDVRSEEAAA